MTPADPPPASQTPQLAAPLTGRIALVTGVTRHAGIGSAITKRLLHDGARVFATGWHPHDAGMPWGDHDNDPDEPNPNEPNPNEPSTNRTHRIELDRAPANDDRYHWQAGDLRDPTVPAALVDAAIQRFGAIDIIVANHARSARTGGLATVTAEELDACWAVNARASVLLAQAFLRGDRTGRPDGRIVLFTSGQHLGPMPEEIAYTVSKGAIQQMTLTLADALADHRTTVNCVNPGPTDTGWATPELASWVADHMPFGRWGHPDDAARVVAWLVSDEAAWMTGQVLNAEGGFRRG